MIGITKRTVWNEDYKTAIAKKQGVIPKNEEVKIIEKFRNLYGVYYLVEYQNESYYINVSDIDIKKTVK